MLAHLPPMYELKSCKFDKHISLVEIKAADDGFPAHNFQVSEDISAEFYNPCKSVILLYPWNTSVMPSSTLFPTFIFTHNHTINTKGYLSEQF